MVKDLSRLGRHRTRTALFIDYLRENNVRVYSVTEGIDSSNENDDMIIGFKQLVNGFYAKDIGKKVRASIRQKQKTGMPVILPMGYYKDKFTGEILLLVRKINVHENEDESLNVSLEFNGDFKDSSTVCFEINE